MTKNHSQENILEVSHLNKSYGKQQILKNISFSIQEGEIVGFIGPNGAGKSTTMKCLSSLVYPDSGKITILGYDLSKDREKALALQSSLIEAPGLYPDLSGRENIKLIARLRQITKEREKEIFDFVRLGRFLDEKTSKYSMGMKQRLALGIAIMTRPKLLILDEPTNGLDPTSVIQLRKTLQELVEKEKMSILFSSHQLGEVEKIANRILCINKGCIISPPSGLEQTHNYILEVSSSQDLLEKLSIQFPQHVFKSIDKNMMRLELTSKSDFGLILSKILAEDIKVLDIQKDLVDIETLYKEIYV